MLKVRTRARHRRRRRSLRQNLPPSCKREKSLRPRAAQPGIETLETYLKTYGTPLYEKAAEKAPVLLAAADAKARGTTPTGDWHQS